MFQLIPLAAGEIVGLIVFIITVISWIFNIISQYSQQQQQRQAANSAKARTNPPPRPTGSETRREVDDFIQRQRLEKKRKRSQDRSEQNRGGGRPEPARTGNQRPGGPPPLPAGDEPARRPVGGAISSRHVQMSDLGAGVRDSVREHLVENSLSKTVDRDMRPQVSASVQSHLGAFTADSGNRSGASPAPLGMVTSGTSSAGPATSVSQTPVSAAAQSLVQMFRNPTTLRQSMIVNFVLSKPAAMTRSRTSAGK